MFDYLLTDLGTMTVDRRNAFRKEIGILGIGMNTLDLLVVRDGRPVQRFSGGDTLGVRRLLELANHNGMYSLADMDSQLRGRSLDTHAALPIWEAEVIGYVEKQWGTRFEGFHSVVIVGGGATIMRERLLRRFRNKAHIPDDPVISTARGLYKYMLMKARR
jgi:hypothetical protein